MPRVDRLCPSGRCRTGSTLLGILGPGGAVIYTPGLPTLTENQAIEFGKNGGSSSFRFTEPCQQSNCLNWANERCEVATAAVTRYGDLNHDLPPCGIRAQCQWFAQEGRAACHGCRSSCETRAKLTHPPIRQHREIRATPARAAWQNGVARGYAPAAIRTPTGIARRESRSSRHGTCDPGQQ